MIYIILLVLLAISFAVVLILENEDIISSKQGLIICIVLLILLALFEIKLTLEINQLDKEIKIDKNDTSSFNTIINNSANMVSYNNNSIHKEENNIKRFS